MNNHHNFSMNRTCDVKFPWYKPDGQGRDTYIGLNNGGLCPVKWPKGTMPKENFNSST